MIRRRYVSVRLLKAGMVIDQSIIDKTGRVLVARKSVLDDYVIQGLSKLNIPGVYIREGDEEEEAFIKTASPEAIVKIEKLSKADPAKISLSESVKERVNEGVQYMFQNPKDQVCVDAANNISNELMKAILDNDALAVDIGILKVSDEYTFKHSVDVASMAMIIARRNKMSDRDVYQIGVAGLLHDLGKCEIPNEILNKPDKLTDREFEEIKKHPVYGYSILKEKKNISNDILLGVLQHHEKINGSGYPLGVKPDKMGTFAQILAVADIYDALVTERPYKKAFSPRDAVEMIMSMTRELDKNTIKLLMNSVILYPVGSEVVLSNGERGKVVENILEYPTRPTVVGFTTGKVYRLSEDINCANIIVE